MSLPLKIAIAILLVIVACLFAIYFFISTTFNFQPTLKLIIGFMIIFSTSLTAWFLLYKSIVKPIKDFNEVAKIVATGNLGSRLSINSNDEIGELSNNINLMINSTASALQHMANSLRDIKWEKEKLALNIQKLDQSRAKDQALIEALGDGLLVVNQEGKLIKVNKAFEKLLGYQELEVINKNLSAVIKAQDKQGLDVDFQSGILNRVLAGERFVANLAYPFYFLRKDGNRFPVDCILTPIVLDNKTIGAVGIFNDITKEQEVDRMKSEFISLASHQLRTPLSAIRWLTEILTDETVGKLTAEQKDVAKNINLSAIRMVDLVNSLLNISRIESGRIIIDPKPTNLIELVSSIITDLQVKIRDRSQNLALKIPSKLPDINLDSRLISQVYVNLLTNAIKYSPKGSVISIEMYVEGENVLTKIADQGFGIPKEEQSRVFNKFYRGKNIIKVETDGTGLGLYLVKAIVESSKGKIWFESTEGKGTTFWFSLPLTGTPAKAGEVTLN
jgi:PAS domain S-box-containing protein